jgi:hypothetical protein
MKVRSLGLALTLLAAALPATAADGLMVRSPENVWPQWHARIELQTVTLTPLATSPWLDSGAAQRGLKGGAVLGDYYFSASEAGFRASGGLMMGPLGGAFSASAAAGSRLGLSLSNLGSFGSTSNDTVPYLGLGFTGLPGRGGLAITADVGLVAAGSVSRALFGNQGMDMALRELRLSPVLQLGVRYQF